MMEYNIIYNEDCIAGLKNISDNSVDVICTDPPYLYLKNQKLDRPFDEIELFTQIKRILKKDGFIIMFGRGTSFYRWNTILADFGFTFKEEFIWDKGYCTSPLMPISRIHETISIHTLGKGSIIKRKIPYLEQKKYNIPSIIADIKRLRSVFNNAKSLKAVQTFLEKNVRDKSNSCKANNVSVSSDITIEDRSVGVMRSLNCGCNEKTIIRTDRHFADTFTKFGVNADKRKSGDRCCNVMQSVQFGLNEKSIIKETPLRRKAIHPTEKPVRLIERLLNLVCNEGTVICDPFSGSGSTAIACINTNRKYIGFEIDKEYYDLSMERITNLSRTLCLK